MTFINYSYRQAFLEHYNSANDECILTSPLYSSSIQLLCLIGEAFGEESDQICGGVISNRRSGSRIAVWTSDYKDSDAVKKIGLVDHLTFSRSN